MSETPRGGDIPVSALVDGPVSRIAPSATLQEVASVLVAGNIGALVVGDGERAEGIISERDLVRAVAAGRALDTTGVMEVANTDLVWCDLTATIAEVAKEMMDHYLRHVLVEDDGALVGIVSARDLLGAYVASDDGLPAEVW
jgi:CBS domain-containing protein